ncbi:putative nuclease HARBI1 [Hypomesus transpacificus]|uniref:putative nuclease HARBI1 n=1 Tax=Hypomesus transpacificus TaxID=137520 RepID=UPI001F082EAE|nr:putative nuclease HARBI1 [Hypomesus transpacificus]XP_046897991.1 putative nuclease HARBI1 [Hypomesus transpacificus]
MAIPIAILDCDLLLHGRGHKTLDRFDIEMVSDEFLLTTFGFPREFIYYLVELLRDVLSRPTQRSRAISPEVQVLAALGFYTSGSFQTIMGDAIGISQASMSRCVTNVTRALVEKAPEFIGFTRDEATKQQSKDEFFRVAGFPDVLGVVDCVHVAIKAPNSEDSSYVNKKGFHSVNCQLVCDARGLLLSAETHWPGSLQDSLIFSQSCASKLHQEQDNHGGWLLGDRRYPLKKWLMTPIQFPETPAEFRYNLAHGATQEIVDRTFRAIQTRFRCLDGSKGYMQYSPEKCSHIILACCVLHNASLQSGLDAWTFERTDTPDQSDEVEEKPEDVDPEALQLRKELTLNHFS